MKLDRSKGTMTYQILSSHTKQNFSDTHDIKSRYSVVKNAMQELIIDINKITQAYLNSSAPPNPVKTLLEIRTGSQDLKSYYECMNQLIHYTYCLLAAHAVMNTGNFSLISILPTAKANNKGFDIEATSKSNRTTVIGEVFCSSDSLFQSKKTTSIKKLDKHPGDVIRVVFFNESTLSPIIKRKSDLAKPIWFYSIDIENKRILPKNFPTSKVSYFGNVLNLSENITI